MTSQWYKPAGSTAAAPFDTVIDPGIEPEWAHTGLRIATVRAGESVTIETGPYEYLVLPLSGGGARVSVRHDGETVEHSLDGRADVFSAGTDLVYAPRDSVLTVTADAGGRIAFPYATAARAHPVVKLTPADIPDELRGAGRCSRQVRNLGTPATLPGADSIIACEVITPAGNWSSYPPHKHDEELPGRETSLEEIYYFELRTEPGGPVDGEPFSYQRVYGTAERPIDVLEEVRAGDVVLVPHGWHGPAIAPPGYDLYYLNVMAGPGAERAWLISDDPAHAWVRDTWTHQDVDPRLPL